MLFIFHDFGSRLVEVLVMVVGLTYNPRGWVAEGVCLTVLKAKEKSINKILCGGVGSPGACLVCPRESDRRPPTLALPYRQTGVGGACLPP